MKTRFVLCFIILSFPLFAFSQTGQFTSFVSIESEGDSIIFEYQWWELDPIINSKILLNSQEYCEAVHVVTTGSHVCIVDNLESGWYEYYLYLEDGDQLIDSTDVGFVFVSGRTSSVSEVSSEISRGNFCVYDMLGKQVGVWSIRTGVLYIVQWPNGKIEKVCFR